MIMMKSMFSKGHFKVLKKKKKKNPKKLTVHIST